MANLTSCFEGRPLISFDGVEQQASVLNYNLPASTTFTVRVFIPIEVPENYWNENAKTLQDNSPYVDFPKPDTGGLVNRHRWEDVQNRIKPALPDLVFTRPTWDSNKPDPPPEWAMKAQQTEGMIRELGTSHPSLKVLNELSIAADLKTEIISSQSFAESPITPLNLKLKDATSTSSKKQPIYSPTVLLTGLADGKLPVWDRSFYGRLRLQRMMTPVKKANPQLFVIHELEIANYLGDYGAGKTVQTFSLLPGEKTTISIKTWRTEKEEIEKKQNILDSYSEESANTFEEQTENEFAKSMQIQSASSFGFSTAHSSQTNSTESGNVGGGFDIGFFSGGGDYSSSTTTGQTDSNSTQSNVSTTLNNTENALQKGLDRHVNQSSAARKHEVNVETKETASSETGMEETITRELQNINHSRVLNFVFRALNQEFLTIVYLKDVSFGFTKGVPGDGVASKIDNLDNFLSKYLKNDALQVKTIRNLILENLLAIYDHNGMPQQFITQDEMNLPSLDNGSSEKFKTLKYWHKNPALVQEWEGKQVKGVILGTAKRILPTDAIIVEGLLGQGEALDCYNMRLQNAASDKADLDNERARIALEILNGSIEEMTVRAEAFSQMFNSPPEHKHKDGNS